MRANVHDRIRGAQPWKNGERGKKKEGDVGKCILGKKSATITMWDSQKKERRITRRG